ncbi:MULTISPECIES: hypothetical protein [unclassified Fischerella]|jgi:hypothetical protein|nr:MULTISPECIES: hypothetical protein [unclassified Fischerella]
MFPDFRVIEEILWLWEWYGMQLIGSPAEKLISLEKQSDRHF